METPLDLLAGQSLFDSLKGRRSRRFGKGMSIPSGPFTYKSAESPAPLTEEEEAALVFAGAGITGYALADLSYGPQEGGTMVAALVGRTVSSADAIQNCALVVINDNATYLIKRPSDLTPAETANIIKLTQQGQLVEAYRAMRQTIRAGRTQPPLTPPHNFTVNHWSVYSPGTSYFLPVMDVTRFYINGVMEMFDEGMDLFLVDERAGFRPAGLRAFGQSKGGPLHDDPRDQKMGTIAQTETVIAEMIAVEVGMMLQNIHLMAQAIGLSGWPNFARHESGWFKALGFTMGSMPSTTYLGASPGISLLSKLAGKTVDVDFPLGLDVGGKTVLKPYCPPYFPSMRDAVYAVADEKFGPSGTFRGGAKHSAWQNAETATDRIPAPKKYVVEATAAYCQYIYDTYGRFPAYLAPYRTLLGSQVAHLDTSFYDRFFTPDALTENQRHHDERWHRKQDGAASTSAQAPTVES